MMIGGITKLCLAVLLAISGCSPSRIAIDRAAFSRLQAESTIAVITHAPEPFSFLTAGDRLKMGVAAIAVPLAGLFVGRHAESLARTQGAEMVVAHGLQDPAHKIRDAFIAAVASQVNLRNLSPVHEVFANDDIKAMGEKLGVATVLDFKSIDWRLSPTAIGSSYRLYYRLRSRLFRTGDGTVLWQGDCRYDRDDADATLAELTANSGEQLRARMDQAAEFCSMALLLQFLGQE